MCTCFWSLLEPNQLITLMLILWNQLSESVSRPPLFSVNPLQQIVSLASWVLSNPVDFTKCKRSPMWCTVRLYPLFFILEKKKDLCLSPRPWEATVWHASNAPTHTPSQSAPSLPRCPHPSVWAFFSPSAAARQARPGVRLICPTLGNLDSESESPATVLLRPFIKPGSRVWWIVGRKPMRRFCSVRPRLPAPGCLASWSLSKGLFVCK